MTLQLKKKDLKEMNVLKFGYCEIQNIERFLKEIGYTCWLYGRNETIYSIEWSSYYISTWYRPTGTRPLNIKKWIDLDKKIESRKYKVFETWSREKKHNYINKKVYDLVQEHIKILYHEK